MVSSSACVYMRVQGTVTLDPPHGSLAVRGGRLGGGARERAATAPPKRVWTRRNSRLSPKWRAGS
jgi:hypothetical protein